MKHKMIATKSFAYSQRALKVGEEFDALDDKDALILSGIGKARRVETRAVKADDSEDEPTPELQNRRYRRRDMQAQKG